MKKSLYILSVVFLIFTSCSTDSDNSVLLIKKIVAVSENSAITTIFSYNGTKLNTIVVDNFRLEHTYSGDKIVNVKRYYGTSLDEETFYEYDNLGRVSSELIVYYVSDFSQKNIYTYNANNTISFQILSGDQSSQSPTNRSGLISRGTNEEVLKVEFFNQDVLTSSEVFTYDAKNSPYKNIMGYDKLPLNRENIFNMLTSVSSNANQDSGTNSIYEYGYNGSNFPETRMQSFYENGVLQSNVNSSYFY